MNSLFNSALKQSSAVRRDLETFAEAPAASSPALQGQISASITSLARTIDDYSTLSKRELIPAKQEKAFERVKNFRAELSEYKIQFEGLRKERDEAQNIRSSHELSGRRPHHTSTPENPYAQSHSQQSNLHPRASYGGGGGFSSSASGASDSYGSYRQDPDAQSREDMAYREQSFISNSTSQLDELIERGRQALGDLGSQNEMLKGTQRKLYSVGNTLGISGDTIRMVERRAKQDKWIFYAGVVIFFLFCWLVIHFLR